MKALVIFSLLEICIAKDWHEFKLNFNKIYIDPSEELMRKAVFEKNRIWMEEHNERFKDGLETYEVAMNEFGDLTDEEFTERYLINNEFESKPSYVLDEPIAPDTVNMSLPESINWAMHGAVTPVQSQGSCGSCWAFSAAGALEAQIFKKTGKLVPLSEQNLVDCSGGFGNNGCSGGMPFKAFKYIIKHGVQTEESYPYHGEEGQCQFNETDLLARMTTYVYLNNKDDNREEDLKTAVATVGPISACLWSTKTFKFFSKGIFFDTVCQNKRKVNHAVLVVGYGRENDTDYWLLKNSWGTTWGENGFGKMARNRDDHCNIASHSVYPII